MAPAIIVFSIRPKSVSTTPFDFRMKSFWPTLASRLEICWLTVGWLTISSSEARLKDLLVYTALNVLSHSRLIMLLKYLYHYNKYTIRIYSQKILNLVLTGKILN
jgi:hypothetical protein